ncbi:MAG: phage terminase large subunit [Hyphomicrobiaceae bacterium]
MNDKRTGAIVLIMQRLHLDDPTGHLLAQGGWQNLVLPAIAEVPEHYTIRTALSTYTVDRQPGDALHPEREPLSALEELKKTLGSYVFAGQYQQSPVPLGGGIIKREWLQHYQPGDLPQRFDMVMQSWDTANKESELSDYSVCTTWGLKGKKSYLLHVLRKRMVYPELKRTVVAQAQLHHAQTVLIEDRASGTQLIQELKALGQFRVVDIVPKGEKFARMLAQTAGIEAGQVLLPVAAPWLDDYVSELEVFPFGPHDDQVDSTSQALGWIATDAWANGMGLFHLVIREAAAIEALKNKSKMNDSPLSN